MIPPDHQVQGPLAVTQINSYSVGTVYGMIGAFNEITRLGAAVTPINVYLSSVVFLTLPAIYLSHRIVDSHWDDQAQTA